MRLRVQRRTKIRKSFETCKGRRGRQEEKLVSVSSFLDDGTMGLWDVAADRRKKFSHCLIFPLSRCRCFWTMGRWDDGTMGRWDVAADRKKKFSHCPIFPFSHCLSWTMGLWDYEMMGRSGRRKEKLFPFSHFPIFPLSLFLDYATSRPTNNLARPSALRSPERTVR